MRKAEICGNPDRGFAMKIFSSDEEFDLKFEMNATARIPNPKMSGSAMIGGKSNRALDFSDPIKWMLV